MTDLLEAHIVKTESSEQLGIERDLFYLKMHEFGLRNKKEPIADLRDIIGFDYKNPKINVTKL